MNTSTLVLALFALSPGGESSAALPAWITDYALARTQSAEKQKPLAIVLGRGKHGYERLARETLSDVANAELAKTYICVHIDTTTKEGKQLAKEFSMTSGVGLVLSDRKGELQAFHHEGDLPEAKLVQYLKKYGSPDYVVEVTHSKPARRKAQRMTRVAAAPANC